MTQEWARRGDGVVIGLRRGEDDHPSPGLRGMWQVIVRPDPGDEMRQLVLFASRDEQQAREQARHVWHTYQPRSPHDSSEPPLTCDDEPRSDN